MARKYGGVFKLYGMCGVSDFAFYKLYVTLDTMSIHYFPRQSKSMLQIVMLYIISLSRIRMNMRKRLRIACWFYSAL